MTMMNPTDAAHAAADMFEAAALDPLATDKERYCAEASAIGVRLAITIYEGVDES